MLIAFHDLRRSSLQPVLTFANPFGIYLLLTDVMSHNDLLEATLLIGPLQAQTPREGTDLGRYPNDLGLVEAQTLTRPPWGHDSILSR